MIVYATLTVPSVILQEAFLSFLGLGVQPPKDSGRNPLDAKNLWAPAALARAQKAAEAASAEALGSYRAAVSGQVVGARRGIGAI